MRRAARAGSWLAAIAAALGLAAPAAAQKAVEVAVTVRADRPGPVIHRYVYGQFAEHLGTGIYEGVWVGPNSKIPNTRGYRNDVVAALKKIKVPTVRWPGGCFADEYHWRDGIGARDKRPVRVNTHWGGVTEDNSFGTHEFMDFAELIGADAYVAGNMGSGTPQEMAEWVEYMTADNQGTLAQERRKNGRDKPWKLPLFGIGNETWGCGGNMRPEYSADLHRRFATFVKVPAGTKLIKVASGANGSDYNWTEVMMAQAGRHMDALSAHYYTLPTGDWSKKGPSTGFGEAEWAATLSRAIFMDELLGKHSAVMDKHDPQKRVGLYMDEWGTWYDPAPGRNPGFLWQQNTLRDAQVAALTFNIFHRRADRVTLAAIAQMVNVLQAMILTDGPQMVLTPTYHVFDMYVPFQDATFLPAEADGPSWRSGEVTLKAVDVSAARAKDGRLWLALVNTDPNRPARATASISGVNARSVAGRVLTAAAMDAHNDFGKAPAVTPQPYRGRVEGGRLVFDLPAKSIAVVAVD